MSAPRPTLLAAARRAGIAIGFPCRGDGICGRCAVEIVAGGELLDEPDGAEMALLQRMDAGARARIACLARVQGPGRLELRVGGATRAIDLRRAREESGPA